MKTYIFGYGSLINKRSAEKTGNTYGEFIPVKISGYQRHCDMAVPEIGMKALGIIKQPGCCLNGVIYEVRDTDLTNYDEREIGYKRVKISNESVKNYNQNLKISSEDNIYLYESTTDIDTEGKELGIYRSYIDVCLDGCLDFGEEFTKDFCETTLFSQKIINDRENKIYLRSLDDDYNYSEIDKIYEQYLLN